MRGPGLGVTNRDLCIKIKIHLRHVVKCNSAMFILKVNNFRRALECGAKMASYLVILRCVCKSEKSKIYQFVTLKLSVHLKKQNKHNSKYIT